MRVAGVCGRDGSRCIDRCFPVAAFCSLQIRRMYPSHVRVFDMNPNHAAYCLKHHFRVLNIPPQIDYQSTHLPSCMNRFSMQHTMSKWQTIIIDLDAMSVWPLNICCDFFRTINLNIGAGRNGLESGKAHPFSTSLPIPFLPSSLPLTPLLHFPILLLSPVPQSSLPSPSISLLISHPSSP
jgi:hypothetical protein